MFKRGEAERLTELLSWFLATSGVARSESTLLCVFPTCTIYMLLSEASLVGLVGSFSVSNGGVGV